MLILAIETSCDETAASIVENGTTIISHVKATTLDVNRQFGGVVPDRTAREQLKLILPVVYEAIKPLFSSQPIHWSDSVPIDAIAVTSGPGLIGSLLVGVETAKALALAWNKPLIPVNHLIGHLYACWLTASKIDLAFKLPPSPPAFPAISLIASGAHCELVLIKTHHHLKLLGSTLDDAAGECFDKCGRLLSLPYPYGPYIEVAASKFRKFPQGLNFLSKPLPRPLINQKGWNFSFSGLKTAFLNEFQQAQKLGKLTPEFKTALANELQEAVSDVLSEKLIKAAKQFNPSSLILTGGVAANARLREKLQQKVKAEKLSIPLFVPPIPLCTDNAAYIASAAFFHQQPLSVSEIKADPALTVISSGF